MNNNKYVCIHGHFYQPPRENAWLGDVEVQDSAYPYHDWNERVTAECYTPNTSSRIFQDGKIINIVNNYEKLSFNMGPTLLSWIEKHAPDTYRAVLEADRISVSNFSGHGSAIAQVFNHLIMPLANRRDKQTQVAWGIADFRRRFGRMPEGMWLSETAVDSETLSLLADAGIMFTILSPHQASGARKIGQKEWTDVSGSRIDPRRPYLCVLPQGKTIVIFFYDGPVSSEIGFGKLLDNGEVLADKLLSLFGGDEGPLLSNVATDGETYGHHHPFGDMALAYAIYRIGLSDGTGVTVYGEYLEKYPPEYEVKLYENSSWSCVHGVERWKNNCGCSSGMHPGWSQEWRAPLREAMDWLRDRMIPVYENGMRNYVADPWAVRDAYIEVISDPSPGNIALFLKKHAKKELSQEEKKNFLILLEMQKYALYMYTSCGWFFDELSGIETVQVMQYAAKAMEAAATVSKINLEHQYNELLGKAVSNIPGFGNGARVYREYVQPSKVDTLRIGAHGAIRRLFNSSETLQVFSYTERVEHYSKHANGANMLATGIVAISSPPVYEEKKVCFALLYVGGLNLSGGVAEFRDYGVFEKIKEGVEGAFRNGDLLGTFREIDAHFGSHQYSIKSLFKDEQRRITNEILEPTFRQLEKLYREFYFRNREILKQLEGMNIPLGRRLGIAKEFVLNNDFLDALVAENLNLPLLRELSGEIGSTNCIIDRVTIGHKADERINRMMEQLERNPDNFTLEQIKGFLEALGKLQLGLHLWKSQNIFFRLSKNTLPGMLLRKRNKDEQAETWLNNFVGLQGYLNIKEF